MATLETLVIEVDGDVSGATSSLSSLESKASSAASNTGSSLQKVSDGFDTTDTRAMGLADTVGGLTDTFNALTDPTLSTGDRLVALGMGVSDLASGFVNFLIPVIGQYGGALVATTASMVKNTAAAVASRVAMVAGAVATGTVTAAQWLWNAAMTANPIGLIIVGIAALIAAIVWLVMNWDKVKAAGTAAWDFIKRAWNGAGDFFKRIWENLPAAAKMAFNSIARWWNNSIGNIGFTVPTWVPVVGGRSFSVPDIPLLANGGIVTGPTLAMVGEGRHDEAVIPLPKGMKDGLLGGGGGSEVTIRIDGTEEDLIRLLRVSVNNRGGDVQAVLGS